MTLKLDDYFDAQLLNSKIFELARHHLFRRGWYHSIAGGAPLDAQGPVPWITYPAMAMLARIVQPSFRVFEFGCGNSTIWWSQRVAQVVAVDHLATWVERVRSKVPSHVTIVHRGSDTPCDPRHLGVLQEFFDKRYDLPVSGSQERDMVHGLLCRELSAYAAEILNYPAGHFDVVVVDGVARVLTAWLAMRQLNERGLIVLDNSDRWQYNAASQFLTEAGFAKVDFWGAGPCLTHEWCTSIFVKNPDLLQANPTVPRSHISDVGW